MKTANRILICVFVVVPIALFIANLGYFQYHMYRLRHADHRLILEACQEMVEKRASYRNDKTEWEPREGEVWVNRPFPERVPKAVRDLKPHRLIIRPDYAMLTFAVPFFRTGLLGFRTGSEQFGTFRYIDGLWFWDGNDSTKPKETDGSATNR